MGYRPTTRAVVEEFAVISNSVDEWVYQAKSTVKSKAWDLCWFLIDLLIYITVPVWVWFIHPFMNWWIDENGDTRL